MSKLLAALLMVVTMIAISSRAFAEEAPAEPFAFADFSWAPGNYAPPEPFFKSEHFVPELRVDSAYHYSLTQPKDDTISGSSEVFRHNELQLTQIGFGGDANYKNVAVRLMTQFGMYSTATPRNDSSPSRGQWQLDDAYRYISEAYASYHLDYMHGVNIQAGIFMSYIGLWSYYNFDNWTYQPSYVSSNTPWFFNGMRVQFFPTDKLKIEPWIINGWQSYGKFDETPGLGVQVLYKPNGDWTWVSNDYWGYDTLGAAGRQRVHSDNSTMYKYYEKPANPISKAAASLTIDAGCEQGDGVDCGNQYFLGFMAYNRLWFHHDQFAITVGGGAINNPGRYLVLTPPINGATNYSGSSYFPQNTAPDGSLNRGIPFQAWDYQVTGDWMPTRNVTFRLEYTHRQASVPYFEGASGMTPPDSNGIPVNQGSPGATVPGWTPDLVKYEDRITAAMMVRL